MPYTTRADGDVITASSWNATVRDQVVSTVTSAGRPSGTEGQLIATTDLDRIEVFNGSAWTNLLPYSSSGREELRVRRTSALSIPSGASTSVTWPTEDVDTLSVHAASASVIFMGTGLQLITASYTLASVPANRHFCEINITSAITGVTRAIRNACTGEDTGSLTAVIPSQTGDSYEFRVFHTNGSAINLTDGWLEMIRVCL